MPYSDSSKGRVDYEWRPQSYTAWDGTIQFYKYNDKGEKRSPNGIFSHTGTDDSSDSNSNGNNSGNDSEKDHYPVNEKKPSSLPSLGSSENENTPHTQYMGLLYCCNPLFLGIDFINKMTIGYAPFYDGIESFMDGLCFLTIDRFHEYSSYSHEVYSGRDKQMTQFGTYIAITLSLIPGAGSIDDAAGATTRVGRWMSIEEYNLMKSTGVVQEGSGGLTYASTSGPQSFMKQAANGSVYVEYNVPTNSLLPGGQAGWVKTVGPNAAKSQQFMLLKQGGVLSSKATNISDILLIK